MSLIKVQTFCRKMEQLVLLVKVVRALKLPLLFARGEIRVGHLKSSNAVKNGETDRCSEALPFSTGACNKPQRSIEFFYYLCLQFSVLNDLNSRYHQCLETCMREILSRIKSAFCNIIALVLLLFALRLA